MNTREREACLLCRCPGELLHADLRDALFGAPGSWSLRRCAACGLVWLDPVPVHEALAGLYTNYHTHREVRHPTGLQQLVRRAIPAAVLGYDPASLGWGLRHAGRLLGRIGPLREAGVRAAMGLPEAQRGRLLDVGCGSGLFLRVMRDLGWDVTGVELDPRAARAAAAGLDGAVIHVGELPSLDLPAGSFDAVTMSHVIEHLLDPAEQLEACRRLLRPGGWLALATPNAQSLGGSVFGRFWRGWEPPRHIHVFDPKTLALLVREHGFRILSVDTPSGAAYFSWAQSFRAAKGREPRLAGIRATVFWLREYLWTRLGRPRGEEVLLIAEKPL